MEGPVKGKHVVAWYSFDEWLEVYRMFYSTELKEQIEAINRVSTWKARLPALTTGVEVTCILVQSKIYDIQQNESSKLPSTLFCGVKFSYAVALIRFINFATALKQGKVKARSLYDIADDIGLPSWLIELRHDSTHGQLAKLDVYRNAIDECLKFLKTFYWEKQKNIINEFCLDEACAPTQGFTRKFKRSPDIKYQKQIKFVMQDYIQYSLKVLSSNKISKPSKSRYLLKQHISDIDNILLRSGFSSLQEVVFFMKVSFPLFKELKWMNYNSDSLEPSGIFSIVWKPIINIINLKGMLCEFISYLVEGFSGEENPHVIWELSTMICYCLRSLLNEDIHHQVLLPVHPNNTKFKVPQYWKLVLLKLLASPHRFTLDILKMVLLCYPDQVPDRIRNILYAAVKVIRLDFEIDSNEIYEDIKTISSINLNVDNPANWKPCNDIVDWSLYPIGTLPNQIGWKLPAFNKATHCL